MLLFEIFDLIIELTIYKIQSISQKAQQQYLNLTHWLERCSDSQAIKTMIGDANQTEQKLSRIRLLFCYFIEKSQQPTRRSKGKAWILTSFQTVTQEHHSVYHYFT